jgi:uncharacterized membrane protein YGL010W
LGPKPSLTAVARLKKGGLRDEAKVPDFCAGLGGVPASAQGMNTYFQRQIANYAEYHRNWWNCAMHVLGITFLFLAAVLPLSSIPVFGAQISVAVVMALPVLIYWLVLDTALGLGIVGAAVLLLSTAAMIANHVSATSVWLITAVLIVVGFALQVVGHQVFERRQPALLDNPTHLLLGPMFVMAKLFIALGFRHDLAVVIQQVPQRALHPLSSSPEEQSELHPHS